ncbi:hypothetical protein [Synechococcus sp. CBW1004]|uniref:hypothetical protein n=1 Tax=Synechococcus sp. CBW1004 TaxID=1353136 RepID=UPI0018CF5000|nr:hypothetical protein [Synechococcus sp. CBW1004]QPN63810.1 hypothetical protein H8F25_02785 [Synechococcus sp. CBW1004]
MNLSLPHLTGRLRQPRVLLPVAIGASLLLGIALGRLQGSPGKAPSAAETASTERSDSLAFSDEQLRRSGLAAVRPEVSSGTERPISGFVEASGRGEFQRRHAGGGSDRARAGGTGCCRRGRRADR